MKVSGTASSRRRLPVGVEVKRAPLWVSRAELRFPTRPKLSRAQRSRYWPTDPFIGPRWRPRYGLNVHSAAQNPLSRAESSGRRHLLANDHSAGQVPKDVRLGNSLLF